MNKDINFRVLFWLTLLTFTSGYTNSASIVYLGTPLTHHTGNITNLIISLFLDKNRVVIFLLIILFTFFASGVLAGMIFYKKHVGFSKIFGYVCILSGILYIIVLILSKNKNVIIIFTVFFSGMQNAILTRYKGITTRTSHLTGYLTDASVNLGRAFRGDKNAYLLFLFLISNIIIFCIGAIIGIFFVKLLDINAFFIIGSLNIFSGVFYIKKIYNQDKKEEVLKN